MKKRNLKKIIACITVIVTLIVISSTVFALPSEIDSFSFITVTDAAKSSLLGNGNTSVRTAATLVNTGVPREFYYLKVGSRVTGDFLIDGTIRTASLGNFTAGNYFCVIQKRDPNIGTTMSGWVKIFQ